MQQVLVVQNYCNFTDYYSYKDFRSNIQESVNKRNNLLVYEVWNITKVNKEIYLDYLKVLN